MRPKANRKSLLHLADVADAILQMAHTPNRKATTNLNKERAERLQNELVRIQLGFHSIFQDRISL